MNRHLSLRRVDLFLDQWQGMPTCSDSPGGYYLVLWWSTVPLGELFIHDAVLPGETHIARRIFDAILPALRHYSADGSLSIDDWSDLSSRCKRLFKFTDVPEKVDASLIICTRNRPRRLLNCLESIQNLRCKPNEVIVVDNAPDSDASKEVAHMFAGIRYIREDRPGLDIARNTGARAASQPVVIYTDDDTIIHPLWVFHAVRTFDDPQVSAMTGLVLASELNTEAQWIFEKYWPFNRGYTDKHYDQNFFNATLDKGPPVWIIGAGANMAFRKDIFERVGYFDERLDVGAAGCNGDSEMWYRILAEGGQIHYNPRAVVSHVHRESLTDLRKQIYSYMRGFTAAVLIQHKRYGHRGNLRHLFRDLPPYYVHLLARGFPRYNGRYHTVFQEMKGIFSGLIFYLKNRNTPANIR